jgi:dTMP kinase
MAYRGKFIVVEGPEGTGKTTLASALASALALEGIPAVPTHEPWGVPSFRSGLPSIFEQLAFRAQHVAYMESELERGNWIVCSRYSPSTLVYNIADYLVGLQSFTVMSLDSLHRAVELAEQGLKPDLYLLLTAPPSELLDRIAIRAEAKDKERALSAERLANLSERYISWAAEEDRPVFILDTSGKGARQVTDEALLILQRELMK